MKRYAVFYHTHENQNAMAFIQAVIPSFETFSKNYRFVGIHEAEGLDDLFERLNDPFGQGLCALHHPHKDADVLAPLVVRAAGHASMSVSDIAVDMDDHTAWVCTPSGWEEVSGLTEAIVAEEGGENVSPSSRRVQEDNT